MAYNQSFAIKGSKTFFVLFPNKCYFVANALKLKAGREYADVRRNGFVINSATLPGILGKLVFFKKRYLSLNFIG